MATWYMLGISLGDWVKIASVIGVIIGVVTYIKNSRSLARQRSIENALRYWDAHSKLFKENGYLYKVRKSMEDGSYKRDTSNSEMEDLFFEFLGNIEHIYLLQKAGGVPSKINAYMFGWFAQKIWPELTDKEKAEPYWDLATSFIKSVKLEADKFDQLTQIERHRYFSQNHFK